MKNEILQNRILAFRGGNIGYNKGSLWGLHQAQKRGRRIFFGRSSAGRTALEGFFARLGRKEVVHHKPLIFNTFLKGGIRYEKRI
jgi:hypothetical protein